MATFGINVHSAGGETADVGDVVRTIDVGYTAFARMKKADLIVNDIKPGNVIVGLASYGQATYEEAYNGGMGSNGLTSARHDVLSKEYAQKYPDSFDANTPKEVVYIGSKKLTDKIDIDGEQMDVGKLVLSPTRTYLPIIKAILEEFSGQIDGMIHCTGGAQTKVIKFVDKVHIVKDNLLAIPPLFQMIKEEADTDWREMYQVFNMGHRLELYVKPEIAERIIAISKSFNVHGQIIGRVEANESPKVTIVAPDGKRMEYFN